MATATACCEQLLVGFLDPTPISFSFCNSVFLVGGVQVGGTPCQGPFPSDDQGLGCDYSRPNGMLSAVRPGLIDYIVPAVRTIAAEILELLDYCTARGLFIFL